MSGLKDYVPEGWTHTTFGALRAEGEYTFVGGPFGSSLTAKDYVAEPGVPVIRGNNLDGKRSRFIDDGFVFVTEQKAGELRRNLAFPGDLIFTQRGTLGQVAIIPDDAKFPRYVVSQSQMKLTPHPELLDARFAYYYFRSSLSVAFLKHQVLATGVPHINLGILQDYPVLLPPLPEQRRIADILDRADAVRRKRQEAIRLTQEFLRSAFLEMVGDPVTNPKGWPQTTLGQEVAELRYGTSTKCSEMCPTDGLPVLRIPNIAGGHIAWDDLKYAVLSQNEGKHLRLEADDILFVRSNGNPDYIGRCAVFPEEARPTSFASYLIRARLKTSAKLRAGFVRHAVSAPSYRSLIVREARTTAGNYNISTAGLRRLRFPTPPLDRQDDFLRLSDKVETALLRHKEGLRETTSMFDSLVQRAFQGDLGNSPGTTTARPAPALSQAPPQPRTRPAAPPAPAPAPQPPDKAPTRPPSPGGQLSLFHGTGTLEAVLAVLRADPGRDFARADFLDAVDGLDGASWLAVSKELAAHPNVVKTGQRRGTRYQWGGGQA